MRELSVAFETSSTMRVLILSALLACASAAPSHLFPVAFAALPIAVPTVPAGDLQAANINAQVRILDQAQVVVDQARELAEKATANYNEGVVEGNDLVQEKSVEAFWASEEKKWQALNEAQVAAAKLEGSVASSAQVVPYAGDESIAAIAPGIAAPVGESEKADVKSAVDPEVKSEAISEVKSEDKENVEVAAADVKSADMKSEGEKPAEENKEAVIPEIQKFGLSLQALKPIYPAPVAVAPSVFPSPVVYPAYRGYPISAVQYPQFYAPSGPLFVKHW